MTKRYTWRRDLPDQRDYQLGLKAVAKLPSKVDLTPQMPAICDQGELGSCTACAGGGAFHYTLIKENKPAYTPSRLFIYYNERVLDNTVKYDAGSSIRTCMKALNKYGAANESVWPYLIPKFKTKPTVGVYTDGAKHQVTEYLSVKQDLASLKTTLSQGYPVVFGFSVYSSFETAAVATTGTVPLPKKTESLLGGHAVVLVGYDDATARFTVRNSWGTEWGKNGYFTMPYSYVTNPGLAGDFWTIKVTE
jgi:C1A family cysteine protease